jgi:hypothetical protein
MVTFNYEAMPQSINIGVEGPVPTKKSKEIEKLHETIKERLFDQIKHILWQQLLW